MRKSRTYATLFTAAVLLLTAWAILANDHENPPVTVTETITVTALAEPAPPDAHARLRRYLQSYDPYAVPRACLEIRAVAGDLFDVVNECAPDRELLGRWRVDKKTGTLSRQR
jgi:hypothetical protein